MNNVHILCACVRVHEMHGEIWDKNIYGNARCSIYTYTVRARLFPNTHHVRVDTHCPRHTLLPELSHVLGGGGARGLPRNYEVIGDICESSFNPYVLSMNMQKRRRNEPTMFQCSSSLQATWNSLRRCIAGFGDGGIDVSGSLNANRIAS